jgi:hypothetical protein
LGGVDGKQDILPESDGVLAFGCLNRPLRSGLAGRTQRMAGLLGHRTPSGPDSTEASTLVGMVSGEFDTVSVGTLVNSAEVKMLGMG